MDRDTTTRSGARAPGVERHHVARTAVLHPSTVPTLSGLAVIGLESTKGADKPYDAKGMSGAGAPCGKVPPDTRALEPSWENPPYGS